MVERLVLYLKNPVVISCILILVPVYLKFIPVEKLDNTSFVIKEECVQEISAELTNTPSRTSSRKYYRCNAKISGETGVIPLGETGNMTVFCDGKDGGSASATVFIESGEVEKLYPGRLYSSSGNEGFIIDKGFCFQGKVKWSEDTKAYFVTELNKGTYKKDFFGRYFRFRALLRLLFKQLMYSWGGAGGLILSLLSGSREYLEDGLADSFTCAGLAHILALSGMHLSFFSMVADKTSLVVAGKKYQLYFRLIFVLLFVWFAGFTPSLFRSMVTCIIMILCESMFFKDSDMFLVLCTVCLIHILCRSGDVMELSFILSYASLGGILLFGDEISRRLTCILPGKIASGLGASIGAMAVTWPVSLSSFGSIYPIGIIAAVIVSPLISLFMALSLLFIILSLIMPFLAPVFGSILNLLYVLTASLVKFFATAPAVRI